MDSLAKEYPEVSVDYQHVDAASMFFVTQPERFDVIVTDNLFGDILTDLGAAIAGGIGLAASGNINPARDVPVDVRAGARQRAGHRGQSQGRPDRGDPVRGACCARTWACRRAAAKIEQAVADDVIERQGRMGSTDYRRDRRRHRRASIRIAGHKPALPRTAVLGDPTYPDTARERTDLR